MARALKKTIRLATTRSPVLTAAIRFSSGSTEEIGWSRSTAQIASRIAVAIIVGSPDERTTNPKVLDRKSTRLNSSHGYISYAVFCFKKKKHHKVVYAHNRR